MLPIWFGARDPTFRDKWPLEHPCHLQARMSKRESELQAEELQWNPAGEPIPRLQLTTECYYLILFSGHRRESDLASCIQDLTGSKRKIIPVCFDLCLDEVRCNLLDVELQKQWFHRMRTGQVVGTHASPPCETYTDARWLEPPSGAMKPRPLRSLDFPWMCERDAREVRQYRVGNSLYFTAIIFCTLAYLSGCCATLEHPAGKGPPIGRFRIWDSAYLRRLLRAAECRLFSFPQGPLGQISWKPTTFLCIRVFEEFRKMINLGSTSKGPFATLEGVKKDGSGWMTSGAKAFPPRLCQALAKTVEMFSNRISITKGCIDEVDLPAVLTAHFATLEDCTGGHMGPDFWFTHA